MKFHITVIGFLIVLCVEFSASAQNNLKKLDDIVWERYTTAWVERDDSNIEQREVNSDKILAQLQIFGIQLYIPKNSDIIMSNGNKYIKAFLINNTKDSVIIDRADATISSVKTEIKIDGQWKLFQINKGSSCGNSYYTKKLAPANYLLLKINNDLAGNIKVPYRVTVYLNEKPIVSNETIVFITPELLKLAGTPIKSISL